MTETVLETCADCPSQYYEVHRDYDELVCGLAEGRCLEYPAEANPPPDWCPLRQGPVTIRLKVRS